MQKFKQFQSVNLNWVDTNYKNRGKIRKILSDGSLEIWVDNDIDRPILFKPHMSGKYHKSSYIYIESLNPLEAVRISPFRLPNSKEVGYGEISFPLVDYYDRVNGDLNQVRSVVMMSIHSDIMSLLANHLRNMNYIKSIKIVEIRFIGLYGTFKDGRIVFSYQVRVVGNKYYLPIKTKLRNKAIIE